MDLSLLEIIASSFLALLGGALRIVWTRIDTLGRRGGDLETRVAVLAAQKKNIFHRLERIEEKLDRLLSK